MTNLRVPSAVRALIAASLILTSACSSGDDDDPPPPIATPGALIDAGKLEAAQGNLQAALASFQQAATHAQANGDQVAEAQLYIAFLDLGLSIDAEGSGADAIAFRDLMARAGLPPAGPDVLALNDYFAQLPDLLPADSPNQAELRDYAVTHLLPALQEAEGDLAALPPTVHSTLATPASGTFEIDFTDVLAARTLVAWAEFQTHFVAAYGGSADIDATLADGDVDPNAELLADATFLTLQEPARLVAAQDALRRSIELYDQALASLQAETDDQADDVVIFGGSTPEEIAQSQQEALEIALLLDQVHAAIVAPPATAELPNGYPLVLDLGATFTELDLRNELPDFDDDLVHSALATLGVPVLHGIFPGLTALQANKTLRLLVPLPGGHAVQVLPGAIAIDDGTTSDWGIVPVATLDPTGIEDFSVDAGDGTHATDIAAIYLAQVNTHTPTTDHYFFRVDFVGGKPHRQQNVYSFELVPNGDGSTVTGFVGEIIGDASGFCLTIRRSDTGEIVVGPDATLVGGGLNFIEWAFSKQFLVDAGIANGTEYALWIGSEHTDPDTLEVRADEAMPIRYSIDL